MELKHTSMVSHLRFPSPNGVRPLTLDGAIGLIDVTKQFPSPNGVRPLTLAGWQTEEETIAFPSPNGVRPLTQDLYSV